VDADIAKLVFFAIAVPMWIVWLIGVRYALSRLQRGGVEEEGVPTPADDAGPRDVVVGERLFDGDPEALSRKIAERLASSAGPGAGCVRIAERTRERVVFDCSTATVGRLAAFDKGVVTLTIEGKRVRARYAVSLGGIARLMRVLTYACCFAYGPLFIVGAPALVWLLVVNSEDPNVRWQVFQAAQMIHGVWPPFLFGALASAPRRATAAFFDTMLANVEHLS
jgi:hypothetical protein